MSATLRLADTFARMLGLPESKAARHQVQARQPSNVAGVAMPEFAKDEGAPVSMTEVRHPDGRMSSYPPPSTGTTG